MLFPRNNLPLVFIHEMLISQYPSYVIVKQTKEMVCVCIGVWMQEEQTVLQVAPNLNPE